MSTWDKPVSPSLRPENQVLYADPPAWIAEAFGGRPWFLLMGIKSIHRIGLFSGMGWMLDPEHHTDRINGVRIVCIDRQYGARLFNMTFGLYEMVEDVCAPPSMTIRAVFRERVKHTLLKAVYADVLGGHCV